jgi:hypothetical protein
MLRTLGSLLGLRASTAASASDGRFRPWGNEGVNFIYHLLFCDDLDALQPKDGNPPNGPFKTLLANPPDLLALRRLADNRAAEGRIRALACLRLREFGEPLPEPTSFAVIAERPQHGGLDVLAAFSDGGARYINYTGKLAIFEGPNHPVVSFAAATAVASRTLVDATPPDRTPRRPPPTEGFCRITAIGPDGPHVRECEVGRQNADPIVAAVWDRATRLLVNIVAVAKAKH